MCFYISFMYFFWLFVVGKKEMFFLWGLLPRPHWASPTHWAPAPHALKAGCLQVVLVSVPLPWPVPPAAYPCEKEAFQPCGGQVPVAETWWKDGGGTDTSPATVAAAIPLSTTAIAPVPSAPGSTPIQTASTPAAAAPAAPVAPAATARELWPPAAWGSGWEVPAESKVPLSSPAWWWGHAICGVAGLATVPPHPIGTAVPRSAGCNRGE